MLPRAALLAALLGSAVPPGCAPPPPPRTRIVLPAATVDPGGRPKVTLAQAPTQGRPSESTRVTEDHADPEAQRQFQARIAQKAIPLAPSSAPPRVTATALDDTRRGEAPGMKPAGDIFTATLAEGQRATMPIKLGPGECETFIAQGGLGVIEVDLFLTDVDGPGGRVLKEDPATGPIAVIGGHGECVTGAAGTGTEAVLHAAVRRGAGVVLVRAYRK